MSASLYDKPIIDANPSLCAPPLAQDRPDRGLRCPGIGKCSGAYQAYIRRGHLPGGPNGRGPKLNGRAILHQTPLSSPTRRRGAKHQGGQHVEPVVGGRSPNPPPG